MSVRRGGKCIARYCHRHRLAIIIISIPPSRRALVIKTMPQCDSNSNHPNILNNHHQPLSSSSSHHSGSQLKKSSLQSTTTEPVGLVVPSSNEEQRGLLTVTVSPSSESKSFSSSVGSSGVSGSCSGGVVGVKVVGRESESCVEGPLLYPDIRVCSEETDSSPQKKSGCFNKMFTCRVLVVFLLVTCLVLSFIIPAHLTPTASSEYPAPDYTDNSISGNGGGDSSHQSTGDEDGFDNNIMLDDQPLSLTLKTEIMNLVEPFDILSQPVTVPEPNGAEESNGAPGSDGADGNGDSTVGSNGNGDGGDDDDDNMAATTMAPETETTDGESGGEGASESESDAGGDADNDGESQSENGGGTNTDSDSGPASSESSTSESSNGGSCSAPSGGNSDDSMKAVMDKIESLMDAVKNIDTSIDKMETLVQSTMIDERVYKCMSAINNGNQTQALKYWKQILRYLSTPQKQAAVLNQLIRESYGGTEDHILPVIQFIEQTNQYYGYSTLFKELSKYDHLYKNTAIFTLGHHVKKSCGRDSALYKSLPGAVQSVFADFFTLQNKHNKGYLYYAKRCVSKHYHHCLDVLTKRIDPYVLDGLGNDSEEKKRYHWRLNATDTTVTKFFILNHDQYWVYRLQDLNNSPRFKMEEAGSNAEVEQAHFQLQLHTDDEIMIRVRDTEDYLEEEDFKSDKAEVRLHSFHQADGIPDSPRMFWLVNPVSTSSESMEEPDSCNVDLASVTSTNGNGNGSSK